MKKILKTLGIIFGVLIILVGLGGIYVFYLTSGMVEVADSFFSDINAKNYSVARNHYTKSVLDKPGNTEESFIGFLESRKLINVKETSWGNRSRSGNKGTLEGTGTLTTGGTIFLKMTLVKENEGWKIISIDHDRPNFVIFLMDDLDFDEIGIYNPFEFPTYTGAKAKGLFKQNMTPWLAYAGEYIHTPNIDSLASKGALFTRFYTTSTVCTPSRYSLLTGRYASRSPAFQEIYPAGGPANLEWNTVLNPDELSIAKIMKANGYATGMVGKWHNSGWDGPYSGRVSDIDPGADPRDPSVKEKIRSAYIRGVNYIKDSHGFDFVERIYLRNKEELGLPKVLQVHNMEWVIEGALNFIDQNQHSPFFLYISSSAPHGWLGSGDFLKTDILATPAGMLDTPPKGMPDRANTARRALAAGVRGRRIEATWLDDAIGAVLNRLESRNLEENTIVFFMSDQQSRGKLTNYEGARVPALVKWPRKIKPGLTIDAISANIDIVPTILDAAGIDLPEPIDIDGFSLIPLLTGTTNHVNWRKELMLEIAYSKAIVTKDWKYIALRYPKSINEKIASSVPNSVGWDGKQRRVLNDTRWQKKGDTLILYGANRDFPAYFNADQLYNLRSDSYEQLNLAHDPNYQNQLNRMKSILARELKILPHTFGEFKSQ